MSNDYIKKVLSAGLNINKKRLNEELGDFSGGGSGNAIQYTEQNLTEEQRLQVKKNLGLQYYTTKEISYNRTPNSGVYVEVNGNKYYKISNDTFNINTFLTAVISFNDESTGSSGGVRTIILDDSNDAMAFGVIPDFSEDEQLIMFFLRGGKVFELLDDEFFAPEDGIYINNHYLQGSIMLEFCNNFEPIIASHIGTPIINIKQFPQAPFDGEPFSITSINGDVHPSSVLVKGHMFFEKNGIIIQSSNGPSSFILTVNESGQLSAKRVEEGGEGGGIPQ